MMKNQNEPKGVEKNQKNDIKVGQEDHVECGWML